MADLAPIEYLYGIDSSVSDDSRFYEPPRVVRFRITKKTPKRVYYLRRDWSPGERFVDRLALERDGQVTRKSGGWWESDLTLYLTPPVMEQARKPDLAELKQAMADAHPDRGGDEEAFIVARARYQAAKGRPS